MQRWKTAAAVGVVIAATACDQGTDTDFRNPRPEGAPDVVVISVSGHQLGESGPCDIVDQARRLLACPYLDDRGTTDAVMAPARDAGLAVGGFEYGDSIHTWTYPDSEVVVLYGFLDMVSTFNFVEERWVTGLDNPSRVVVVAHGHGVVWAHTAAMLHPDLPIEALIDLDGESLAWEEDDRSLDPWDGDQWGPMLRSFSRSEDVDWAFDIWDAADVWSVPGLPDPQDIEDVVPDNVLLNLEVASSDLVLRDREPNHRLDGTTDGIHRRTFDERHQDVAQPDSAAVQWVSEALATEVVWE